MDDKQYKWWLMTTIKNKLISCEYCLEHKELKFICGDCPYLKKFKMLEEAAKYELFD